VIASAIRVGYVVGAAAAFASGDLGVIFWIWMTAMVGMSTKAAEIMLVQRYRVKFETMDKYLCGRNYVLKNGLGWTKLVQVLARTFVLSPWSLLVQTNAVATSLQQSFGFLLIVGIPFVFTSLGGTIIGGVRRIASLADKVLAIMAVFSLALE